jgi:large subunit ribosomal protein L11
VKSPAATYFVKKAAGACCPHAPRLRPTHTCAPAGISSGSQKPGHQKRSTISLKHVYEIAKERRGCAACEQSGLIRPAQVKQTDSGSEYIPLQSICSSIIGTARSMGVGVVR